MNASLVFDGSGDPIIPESMGLPNADQFQGTPLEKLGESASRICYQSFGLHPDGKPRGRSAAKLHAHILEVINLSVYEHCNFTVALRGFDPGPLLTTCLNRKGIWVEQAIGGNVEVTANLRAVLEWDKHTRGVNASPLGARLGRSLKFFAQQLAPQIVKGPFGVLMGARLKTEGLSEDQAWVTLYMHGSRGFTHEQVRHRFAMSQRSTRYVDEDGSPYIEHPLITKYLATDQPFAAPAILGDQIRRSIAADRATYRLAVRLLEDYLTSEGMDKQTARKQARGASRGYLGNALASEMLFSAPVSGWKWILKQRASKFADAEIRTIYEPALAALKSSQHGHFFADYELIPSPDGMGKVLKETP